MINWIYKLFSDNGSCFCGKFYCEERAKRKQAAHIQWPLPPKEIKNNG